MQGRLEKLTDVPNYRKVLTLGTGEVPLSTRRQQFLIALELQTKNTRRALLLATTDKCISPDAMDVCSRLRSLGYQVEQAIPASPTLISTLYIQTQEQDTVRTSRLNNTEIEEAFAHLIAEAAAAGASDVHIVCHNEKPRALVRLRVHGEIIDWQDIPTTMAVRLCSSAYNSIAEDREVSFNSTTAQDANIHLSTRGKHYHLRYAHAPSHPHGFHAAIRILYGNLAAPSAPLDTLGFLPGQVACLHTLLGQADGAVIIAGTTGSGKSTTIHSLLAQLLQIHKQGLNILTVEDPPEYRIEGVIQSPVVIKEQDIERGQNAFARMIRSGMRRDPDVLMIGEIRDLPTAISFIQAVQSGHLCLTTLHARSCFSILSRLEGFGAKLANNPINRTLLCEPGLIRGLIYQRLLPALCQHCSIPQPAPSHNGKPESRLRTRGSGCQYCLRGIAGRTVCAQIVLPNSAMLGHMRKLQDKSAETLWQSYGERDSSMEAVAEQRHGVSALDVALYKMHRGKIDPDDVMRQFGTNCVVTRNGMAEPRQKKACISHMTQSSDSSSLPTVPTMTRPACKH